MTIPLRCAAFLALVTTLCVALAALVSPTSAVAQATSDQSHGTFQVAQASPDEKLWQTIKNVPVPGLFKKFLERYPNSRFRADAEAKLQELEGTTSKATEAEQLLEQAEPQRSAQYEAKPEKVLTRGTNPIVSPVSAQASDLVAVIQTELARCGCHTAAIDGYWGPLTIQATARFLSATGHSIDGSQPSAKLLGAVKATKKVVCRQAHRPRKSTSPRLNKNSQSKSVRRKPAPKHAPSGRQKPANASSGPGLLNAIARRRPSG